MIRKMIRSILLETRGPLGIPPVLKAWVKVAAEHGEETNPHIPGPAGSRYADHACLQVPRQHAQKVFDSLSADLQEWVLKHWRSQEYFNAMISGVKIGLIRTYEQPSWLGLKSGTTHIRGRINDEGKMTGSMSGYLTTKINSNRTNWNKGYPPNRKYIWDNGELNREGWLYSMEQDIAMTESTLIHEFQHWFQESIYYAEAGIQIPTKRRTKHMYLPKTKAVTPNIKDLKPIHLMMAKKLFKGVDWNTTKRIRGATAYKLIGDPLTFFDSYNLGRIQDDYAYLEMVKNVIAPMSKPELRAFVEEILYDYLKLEDLITTDELDEIADAAAKGGWMPIRRNTQSLLWRKGHSTRTTIDGEEVHPKSSRNFARDYNPRRDTPQGSGEKTVQGTDSLLKSLGDQFHIYMLKKSDFDKNGNLKPGREPQVPNHTRAPKATWVIIGRGEQTLPRREAGASRHSMTRKRGTHKETSGQWGQPEWTDRWVEFDAVASEYMVALVRRLVGEGTLFTYHLVRSEDKEATKMLAKDVKRRIGRRGFIHQNMSVNAKHIENMAKRVVDRLIEVVEDMPYEDWIRSQKSAGKLANVTWVSPSKFNDWAGGDYSESAPIHSRPYWEWILAKASGENV